MIARSSASQVGAVSQAGPGCGSPAAGPGQLAFGLLGQVGQPVDDWHPGAALHPGGERLGEQPHSGGDAYPAGRPQAAFAERLAAEQEHRGRPGRA